MSQRKTIRKQFPQVYMYPDNRSGQILYQVSARSRKWGLNERKTFTDRQAALDHARALERQLQATGAVPSVPSDVKQRADCYSRLLDRLSRYNKTPEQAVDHFLTHLAQEIVRKAIPTIGHCVEDWEAHKNRDTTLSDKTRIELKSYCRFIRTVWAPYRPDELKKNDIDLKLKELPVSNATRNKYLKFVRGFFGYCKDEGYIQNNPADGLFFKPEAPEAEFYSLDVLRSLLKHVRDNESDLLGVYVLMLFAGLRPSEAEKVQWQDVHFNTGQLYVRKGKTPARWITLEPVCLDWLKYFRDKMPTDTPFVRLTNLENRHRTIRDTVPSWIQDGLRHTFATYFKQLKQDVAAVAEYMGNSPTVVKRNYARTVPQSDLDAFWAMSPLNLTVS